MTLVLELPDSWKQLLGLDTADAAGRAREMLVIESYREGKLSRGQAAEMLGLGFHERSFSSSVTVRISSRHGMSWSKVHKHSERLPRHE